MAALCANCSLTPAAAPTDEDVNFDPRTLRIDIGRNHLILDKIRELEYVAEGMPSLNLESAATMNSMLRAGVWKFNAMRGSMCLYGYLPQESCGPPYLPAWIHETKDAAPSMATLHARNSELSDRVGKFWDAACAEARSRLAHEDWFPLCSAE
jgi:hypothetical protein